MAEKFTSINPVTGDILKSKAPTDVYTSNLEVVQQNNVKNSVYTCEDCATIPCVFPDRGTKCSFFELKYVEGVLQELHDIDCEIFLPSELLKSE